MYETRERIFKRKAKKLCVEHVQTAFASVSSSLGWNPPPKTTQEFVARCRTETTNKGPAKAMRVMHNSKSFKKYIEALKHPEKGRTQEEKNASIEFTAWINDVTAPRR